jgi:hypothetical protein
MALGPINYQMQVATPFESVLQGMSAGAKMADIEMARAAQAAKIEAQRQAMALADQRQKAVADLFASPNPSYEQTANVLAMLPAEQGKLIADLRTRMSDDQRKNYGAFTAKVVTGLLSERPEVATRMIEERAAAEPNPEQRKAWETIKGIAQTSPKDAAAMARAMGAGLFGKDWYETTLGVAEKAPAQVVSTPEQKRNAGLLDDKGAVLSGTYVIEAGKAPTLLQVKDVPTDAVIVSTPEDKRRRGMVENGIPIPGVFAVEPGKAPKRIDKPEGPLVNVNMPGQERPPTPYETERDKKFAPLAVEWMSGGRSTALSRVNQLSAVISTLDKKERVTGPVVGITPDVVNAFINPASREARANAERVIQEGLKAVLGAQFTQKEGEAFLSRSYDPKAPAADNARRLRAIVNQMRAAARDRDAMLAYIEGPGQGTLRGYKGAVPTINDFYSVIDEKPPETATGAQYEGLSNEELLRRLRGQ